MELLVLFPIVLIAFQLLTWFFKTKKLIEITHSFLPFLWIIHSLSLVGSLHFGLVFVNAPISFSFLPKAPLEFQITDEGILVWQAISLLLASVLFYIPKYAKSSQKSWLLQTGLSGFAAAVIGLVFSNNLLLAFCFWELTGLFSFLLIGFNFQKSEASVSSLKAIISAKFGDVFLLGGLLLQYGLTNSFQPSDFESLIVSDTIKVAVFCLVFGALVKAAQWPFSNWLHYAMEGPVPVSAMMHAMALVGVPFIFLLKISNLLSNPNIQFLGLIVLGFSTLWAAIQVLLQTDIKKALAWSTASQMSWPLLALFIGNTKAGVALLIFQGFIKFALFLWAGVIAQVYQSQNLNNISGLFKSDKPLAIIGVLLFLGLAGLPLFGAFFAKEWLLMHLENQPILLCFWIINSALTAFYSIRLIKKIVSGKATELTRSYLRLEPIYLGLILSFFPLGSWLFFNGPIHFGLTFFSSILVIGVAVVASWYLPHFETKLVWLSKVQYQYDELLNKQFPKFTLGFWVRPLLSFDTVIERFGKYLGQSAAVFGWLSAGFDKYFIDGFTHLVAYISKATGSLLQSLPGGKVQLYISLALTGLIIFIWLIP